MSKGEVKRHLIGDQQNDPPLRGISALCEEWGLTQEMHEWGFTPPEPTTIYHELFKHASIEWNRIGSFQDVTMRLVAQRLLADTPNAAVLDNKPTMVQDEVSHEKPEIMTPDNGKQYHLYCSQQNPGALALIKEVAAAMGMKVDSDEVNPLKERSQSARGGNFKRRIGFRKAETHDRKPTGELYVTTRLENIADCEHMLLYLDGTTWTSKGKSTELGNEVEEAMDADVHLLLAHEMPGLYQEKRKGVDFSTFFACDRGATPEKLLKRGIYKDIACPLKGGEWRAVSLVIVARALAATGIESKTMDLLGRLHEDSRAKRPSLFGSPSSLFRSPTKTVTVAAPPDAIASLSQRGEAMDVEDTGRQSSMSAEQV